MTQLSFEVTRRDEVTSPERIAEILENPGFGKTFTDHMVVATWTADGGWGDAQVTALRALPARPGGGGAALRPGDLRGHEGLPSRRRLDLDLPPRGQRGPLRPVGPSPRAARAARGRLHRVAAPARLRRPGLGAGGRRGGEEPLPASLHVRVRGLPRRAPGPAGHLLVIASPAGAYFSGGIKPVTLWISTDYARAGEGGTGAAKCGGNYASRSRASSRASSTAVTRPCSSTPRRTPTSRSSGHEPLPRHQDGRIITPGSPGRSSRGSRAVSILEIAKELGLEPEERRIPIQEWKEGAASGDIVEIFACGTAAVVTPVGELRWEGG